MTKQELRTTKPAERLSRARQRQKLIDACITALHQYGPSRTTIDKVVSIADMSPGIVNFYFETKAALLVAALEHLAVEFETLVLEPLEALRQTPMLALERLIELYLDPDVASPRKVSVWYSFWGESSSRREYFTICGKRDVAFAALVQDLVERLIQQTRRTHLDADAVSLGLIGCLEVMWQEIAFQEEEDIDRDIAKKRCRAYLRSVFPEQPAGEPGRAAAPVRAAPPASDAAFAAELEMFRRGWQFACANNDISQPGAYVAWQSAVDRVVVVRDSASEVAAFLNTCLHRPHQLVAGDAGNLGGEIACLSDGAVYGLDGVRHEGGRLRSLSVAHNALSIFVTHDAETAGDVPHIAMGRTVPVGPWHSYDTAADWKLVMEHFADTYFDMPARLFAGSTHRETWTNSEASVLQVQPLRGPAQGLSTRLYVRLSATQAEAKVERLLIWPNLFVEKRPDGASIRQVLPLAPGRSRVRVRRYRAEHADRQLRALAYLASRIERVWENEDLRAIDSIQAGLAWHEIETPSDGLAVQAFRTWLRRALPLHATGLS